MTKSRTAAMVAVIALATGFMGAEIVSAPTAAIAAEAKGKTLTPKMKPLLDAVNLVKGGKVDEALAKALEADKVAGKTPFETLMVNQVLAAIALCVGTTIVLRMGAWRWCWITLLPLAWLLTVTQIASWERLFSSDPGLGFLAQIDMIQAKLAAGALPGGAKTVADAQRMIFNARLDAVLVAGFSLVVWIIVLDSLRTWLRPSRRGPQQVASGPSAAAPTSLPAGVPPGGPLRFLRIWAGEDAFEKHQARHGACAHERKRFWRSWFTRRASGGRCC